MTNPVDQYCQRMEFDLGNNNRLNHPSVYQAVRRAFESFNQTENENLGSDRSTVIESARPHSIPLSIRPELSLDDWLNSLQSAIDHFEFTTARSLIHRIYPIVSTELGSSAEGSVRYYLQIMRMYNMTGIYESNSADVSEYLATLLNDNSGRIPDLLLAEVCLELARYQFLKNKNHNQAVFYLHRAGLTDLSLRVDLQIAYLLIKDSTLETVDPITLEQLVSSLHLYGRETPFLQQLRFRANSLLAFKYVESSDTLGKGIKKTELLLQNKPTCLSKSPRDQQILKTLLHNVAASIWLKLGYDGLDTKLLNAALKYAEEARRIPYNEDSDIQINLLKISMFTSLKLGLIKYCEKEADKGFQEIRPFYYLSYVGAVIIPHLIELVKLGKWSSMESVLQSAQKHLHDKKCHFQPDYLLESELNFFKAYCCAALEKSGQTYELLPDLYGFVDDFPHYADYWKEMNHFLDLQEQGKPVIRRQRKD